LGSRKKSETDEKQKKSIVENQVCIPQIITTDGIALFFVHDSEHQAGVKNTNTMYDRHDGATV
jgi:hypothetical protein